MISFFERTKILYDGFRLNFTLDIFSSTLPFVNSFFSCAICPYNNISVFPFLCQAVMAAAEIQRNPAMASLSSSGNNLRAIIYQYGEALGPESTRCRNPPTDESPDGLKKINAGRHLAMRSFAVVSRAIGPSDMERGSHFRPLAAVYHVSQLISCSHH